MENRVVPSPTPKKILNLELIRELAIKGNIVITCGGGGIPVFYDQDSNLRTADAVIDKDLASSVLASGVGADEFYILTDVSFIYKDYGLPTQEKLEFLDYQDTKKYLELGTFAEGSMAPKIIAAMKFVENGGVKSIITEASKLEDKSYGSKITCNTNHKNFLYAAHALPQEFSETTRFSTCRDRISAQPGCRTEVGQKIRTEEPVLTGKNIVFDFRKNFHTHPVCI